MIFKCIFHCKHFLQSSSKFYYSASNVDLNKHPAKRLYTSTLRVVYTDKICIWLHLLLNLVENISCCSLKVCMRAS